MEKRVLPTRHSIKQIFIPFTPQDEALLQFYRQMLQSVARGRGVKLIELPEVEKDGLLLNGLPIWKAADGSFSTGRTAPAGARPIRNFGDLSDVLYERLLAPFAGYYQDAQRLIISPDGALSYLPFETLTRRGVSVLEAVDIAYIQSLSVYAELKKRGATRKLNGVSRVLSVADPQYVEVATAPDVLDTPSLRQMRGISWPALPGTRKESATGDVVLMYKDKRQLLGPQASKANLFELQRQKALKDFKILHFATHGYVDDERSALVLSSGGDPLSAYLMDQDIVDWSLDRIWCTSTHRAPVPTAGAAAFVDSRRSESRYRRFGQCSSVSGMGGVAKKMRSRGARSASRRSPECSVWRRVEASAGFVRSSRIRPGRPQRHCRSTR